MSVLYLAEVSRGGRIPMIWTFNVLTGRSSSGV